MLICNYLHFLQEKWLEECCICTSDSVDIYFINECQCKNILICEQCIFKLKQCPFCRRDFNKDTLFIINNRGLTITSSIHFEFIEDTLFILNDITPNIITSVRLENTQVVREVYRHVNITEYWNMTDLEIERRAVS